MSPESRPQCLSTSLPPWGWPLLTMVMDKCRVQNRNRDLCMCPHLWPSDALGRRADGLRGLGRDLISPELGARPHSIFSAINTHVSQKRRCQRAAVSQHWLRAASVRSKAPPPTASFSLLPGQHEDGWNVISTGNFLLL